MWRICQSSPINLNKKDLHFVSLLVELPGYDPRTTECKSVMIANFTTAPRELGPETSAI